LIGSGEDRVGDFRRRKYINEERGVGEKLKERKKKHSSSSSSSR
jgi:hypothetical protein